MKKFVIIFIIVLFMVIGMTNDQFVWCKRMIFGEPVTHIIQDGEYLSKIAKKYYGDSRYWKELALINRAPDSDLVFPGEEILVPKKSVIEEIHRTQWLSKVNQFVKGEQDILARLSKEDLEQYAVHDDAKQLESSATVTTMEEQSEVNKSGALAEQSHETRSSSVYMIMIVAGVLLLVSTIVFLIYRKRKTDKEVTNVNEIDFNDEESEPDYKDYLNKKNKKKEYAMSTN